jgi:hypothetical protein
MRMSHFTALVKGGKLSERVRPRYIKLLPVVCGCRQGELTTCGHNLRGKLF